MHNMVEGRRILSPTWNSVCQKPWTSLQFVGLPQHRWIHMPLLRGVFRTPWGLAKGSFALPFHAYSVQISELFIAIPSINHSFQKGSTQLWLECDSTYAACMFTKRSKDMRWIYPTRMAHLLEDNWRYESWLSNRT